ncbi:MAG: sialidase family protein [Balneolaceae bacterium]|nr:sialidase family protein [Balneolaceae bacterium]
MENEANTFSALKDEEPSREKMNAMRAEYFYRLLRDPKTGAIPQNIRSRELNHARTLPTRNNNPLQFRRKDGTLATATYDWLSAGPVDVGGRTRALGIDKRDSDIVIAGGVSGGMWKSTDGGDNWQLRTDPSQNQSVTSLAQDPTNPDNWYYTSGEFRGQSAADRGNTSFHWGNGVYKSTDDGDNWQLLPNASSNQDFLVDKFNTISRVVISPTSGSIFIASNGFGIYRSEDDGNSFPSPPLLGAEGEQFWADIAVAPDGRLIATLSTQRFGDGPRPYTPGVFVSDDDGNSWTNATPSTFPSTHERSVVTFAPSAPDTAYVLTYVGGTAEEEDVRFHFIDLNSGGSPEFEDRSANIPDFGEPTGYMSTQQNYNMEVAVKPDDPDFVLIGGINLFRSTDGFKTAPSNSEKEQYWIGGYDNDNNLSHYPGQHADQHNIVFDPSNSNSNIVWSAHDGGLSRTSDITAGTVEWDNMDRGYVTSQYYSVDIPDSEPGGDHDPRLIGGTQDNGSPFFLFNSETNQTSEATDVSSGDGGYAFFTTSYIYVSRQEGSIIQYQINDNQQPQPSGFAFVHPSGAENQYFIHPYAVDPLNEAIMYYPDERQIWRNTRLDEIDRNNNPDGISQGWDSFQAALGGYYSISALEVSTHPSDILYYGAFSNGGTPKIYRLNNASSTSDPREISFPEAPSGAFLHDFAINPANADEVMVIFSNYNVASIFYTDDGGKTGKILKVTWPVQAKRMQDPPFEPG